MEISEVRRRVVETIARAKRGAAERRAKADEASQEYAVFLEIIGVPLFRQLANVLKAHAYPFGVFTPAGGVRLSSDKRTEDYIELTLDTAGERPLVIGHASRARGRRVVESERPLNQGPIRDLTEEDVMRFLQEALGPLVER